MKSLNVFYSFLLLACLCVFSSTVHGQLSRLQTNVAPQEVLKGSEVTVKARVTKKPQPGYTKIARKHQVTGTVVIRCVFSASGQVTNIHVIQGLPDGLTERAVEAAQKIKFVPATKDGHPVSMWMELQYNFNLY